MAIRASVTYRRWGGTGGALSQLVHRRSTVGVGVRVRVRVRAKGRVRFMGKVRVRVGFKVREGKCHL